MRRVVVDPGVLVFAIITPLGPPADIVRAVRERRLVRVVCPHLLAELLGVLRREKFDWKSNVRQAMVGDLRTHHLSTGTASGEVRVLLGPASAIFHYPDREERQDRYFLAHSEKLRSARTSLRGGFAAIASNLERASATKS